MTWRSDYLEPGMASSNVNVRKTNRDTDRVSFTNYTYATNTIGTELQTLRGLPNYFTNW